MSWVVTHSFMPHGFFSNTSNGLFVNYYMLCNHLLCYILLKGLVVMFSTHTPGPCPIAMLNVLRFVIYKD